jgi:hypothetical protein
MPVMQAAGTDGPQQSMPIARCSLHSGSAFVLTVAGRLQPIWNDLHKIKEGSGGLSDRPRVAPNS